MSKPYVYLAHFLVSNADNKTLQGTWQFMAARLLMSLEPLIHELADDLESFLQVLNWVALCYMHHELDIEHLTETLNDVFEYAWQGKDGTAKGGDTQGGFSLQGPHSKNQASKPADSRTAGETYANTCLLLHDASSLSITKMAGCLGGRMSTASAKAHQL
jgi:hypothetical protein